MIYDNYLLYLITIYSQFLHKFFLDSKVHFVGICPGRQRSTMVSIGNKVFAYWVTNRSVVDRQTDPERVETPIFLKFEGKQTQMEKWTAEEWAWKDRSAGYRWREN